MYFDLRVCVWATVLAGVLTTGGIAKADKTFFTIGTGSSTGVYHQIGASICRFLRMRHRDHNLDCRLKGSSGSLINLMDLRAGSLDLAIVQSDLEYHAYFGTSVFEHDGPNKELRALFSVVPETFSVVAGKYSGISNFMDLKGQRVNIGSWGSGQRVVLKSLLDHLGWTIADFKAATEIPSALQGDQVCNRKIDAAIYVVAHPNTAVYETIQSCGAALVPVIGTAVDEFIRTNPYFIHTVIPANTYPSIPDPVSSFGVVATVVATSDMPPEDVYHVVKAVFENLDEMRKLLPVFVNLDREFMVFQHHSAPLHPGAIKYFKEAGLM